MPYHPIDFDTFAKNFALIDRLEAYTRDLDDKMSIHSYHAIKRHGAQRLLDTLRSRPIDVAQSIIFQIN